MARSERAAGLIPFIVMLVLFLAAVLAWYVEYSAITKADGGFEARLREAYTERQKQQEVNAKLYTYLGEIAAATGFPTSADEQLTMDIIDPNRQPVLDALGNPIQASATARRIVDALKASNEAEQFLAAMTKDCKVDFEVCRYNFDEGPSKIEIDPDGNMTVGYFTLDKLAKDYAWNEIPAQCLKAVGRMKDHLTFLSGKLNDTISELEQARESDKQKVAEKDSIIAGKDTEMEQRQQRSLQEMSNLRSTIDNLEGRLRKAEEDKTTAVESAAKEVQDLRNQLLAKQQELVRMKKVLVVDRAPTADGQVLAASTSTGIAVINRGKRDNLKPGTVFEVYNFAKGNVRTAKGFIKVLDVTETSAKCGVIKMNKANPIVEGDMIANELYNPEKSLHFFILGKLGKYGASEAKTVLERLGNKVDGTVTVETDYLILGKKGGETDTDLEETAEYKKAKELGVKVITERELQMFTLY